MQNNNKNNYLELLVLVLVIVSLLVLIGLKISEMVKGKCKDDSEMVESDFNKVLAIIKKHEVPANSSKLHKMLLAGTSKNNKKSAKPEAKPASGPSDNSVLIAMVVGCLFNNINKINKYQKITVLTLLGIGSTLSLLDVKDEQDEQGKKDKTFFKNINDICKKYSVNKKFISDMMSCISKPTTPKVM